MPEQALALREHDKNPEKITDNMTTLTATGPGNGFAIPYAKLHLVYIHNASGGSAGVTIKMVAPTAFSDRGVSVSDESATIADGETFSWFPNSAFKNSDQKVVIEADVTIQVKALSRWTVN
jgi:hypothetical protein